MRFKVSKILDRLRVKPGSSVDLRDFDTDWTDNGELKDLTKDQIKGEAQEFIRASIAELAAAQNLLWASDTHSVLVVLQAMDAAGKDGTIKHVMTGVNPQGCDVVSFKQPSPEELDHTFLWRCQKAVPQRGKIVIFNRSHYEDVLVVKVHPEYLSGSKLPPGKRGKSFWHDRYEDINSFERHLARNGTVILKFFLNVSKKEQKRRFLDRLDTPEKNWKFSPADVREREHWDDYMRAYEQAMQHTSTDWAPWYVVPADNKWITRALVSTILTWSICQLDLKCPEITREQRKQFDEARKQLLAE